jgi:hypothetical protein
MSEKKKLTDIGFDRVAFIRSLENLYWTVTRTLDIEVAYPHQSTSKQMYRYVDG